jgi:hypothetical protein
MRISGRDGVRVFHVPNATPVNRLTSQELKTLSPEYQLETASGPLKGNLVSTQDFLETEKLLRKKGFWIFFNGSGPDARARTGHFTVLVNGTLFNRNVDEHGMMSLTSTPVDQALPFLNQYQVIAGQFFELDESNIETLSSFFHDRTWNFHAGVHDYKTKYVPLPHSRDASELMGENCLSFCFPWHSSRWSDLRPELKNIQKNLGDLELSEIPNLQLGRNARSPAYRGTLIVTDQPEQIREQLLTDGLLNHKYGSDFLINGPAVAIPKNP